MRQVWGSAWKGAQDQLESERERAEMFAEISRLDAELDAARTETRERDQALDEARRSHDETRAELREARILVEERSRRIDEQAAELQEARRQSSEALAQSKRLEADLARLNRELGEAKQRADQEAKARTKLAGELDRAQADNRRLSSFPLDEVGLVSEPGWVPRWRLLSGSLGGEVPCQLLRRSRAIQSAAGRTREALEQASGSRDRGRRTASAPARARGTAD
jgi:DNA repair exonuclease SbcCD ATPase subunit